MVKERGRDDHFYRKATARLRRQGDPCWLCGQPIDLALDWRHPMSWTADHLIPLARGGELGGEIRPAHRRCNSARGVGERPPPPLPAGHGCAHHPVPTDSCPHSRDW